METTVLYRPVDAEELRLIEATGMRAFPARLPGQPIFYPVTNEAYAARVARDWNTKSAAKAGFVTRFCVRAAFLARYRKHIVGAREHEEYWIPVEDLPVFNDNIVGVTVSCGGIDNTLRWRS